MWVGHREERGPDRHLAIGPPSRRRPGGTHTAPARPRTSRPISAHEHDRAWDSKPPITRSKMATAEKHARAALPAMREIARRLEAERVPTTSGRMTWHASTVRPPLRIAELEAKQRPWQRTRQPVSQSSRRLTV